MQPCKPPKASCRVRSSLAFGLVLLICASLACNFSLDLGGKPAQAPTITPDLAATQVAGLAIVKIESTQTALALQATQLAQQQQQLDQASTQAALLAQAATPTLPPPTATSSPMPTATVTLPPAPPTAEPTPDIEAMIQDASILLYEDVAGYYDLTRWVSEALDARGWKYTAVGDAVGDFKSEILSGKKWDLVIVAAEARNGFKGELFEYLSDAVNQDAAVIIETWYLDEMALGRISDITSQCGVRFQKDWFDPDRNSRSIVWFDPEHALFHAPNEGFSLVHNAPYWEGDVGDMMMTRAGGGNGALVAGLYAWEKDRYGTIAECYDGRVILQTFSTHDYRKSDMTDLWQNYVYYTLKNHFLMEISGE
jgi:hypothetical protein